MSQEYFGTGTLKTVSELLEKHKADKVFIVAGESSFLHSGAEAATASLLQDTEVTYFTDFSVNPKLEDIQKGVELFNKSKHDVVIAIGGGSVIDTAKFINLLACHKCGESDIITGKKQIEHKGLPLIAIPTTAGSGCESTHFAVVYINKVKYSLAHDYMMPDYSIVDPALTYSMPEALTAVTGFDALSQAIESYWAVKSTEESKSFAAEAIKGIMQNIRKAVLSPTPEVREHMAYAAHLSGKAINISKTTAAHAISYRITIDHGIPHGHAVALSLGRFFIINSDHDNEVIDPRGQQYLENTMKDLYSLIGYDNAKDCSDKLYSLMTELGLANNFRDIGIVSKAAIKHIVDGVNVERLNNNPVMITREMLYSLFK